MKKKRIVSGILAVIMIMCLCLLPASAATTAQEATGATDEIVKYFPEGIPDFLTEEQVQAILDGQYLEIEVDGVVHYYNYENKPMTRVTWTGMDFNKDAVWWPYYARLAYTKTGNTKFASTMYYISDEDQVHPLNTLKGRSWVQIKTSGAAVQNQSETMVKPTTGAWYVYASTTITTYDAARELNYSYRNLLTDWRYDVTVV